MRPADRPVVTGLGVVCAVGEDPTSFENALRCGRTGISTPEPDDASVGPGWPARTAPIRGFALDDALARCDGLPDALRRNAVRLARRAPLGIQVACATSMQAWGQASLSSRPVPSDRIGIVVAGNNLTGGYAWGLRTRFDRDPVYVPASAALHLQDTDHVGTLSELLGIKGEGFTVGGASASGNVALIQASRMIECGAVDACLVVGAMTDLSPVELRSFCNLGAVATVRAGAPFDIDHGGFVPGQGCAAVMMESPSSAARRGVVAVARMCGYALRLDANSLADPSVDGEVATMEAAIAHAGLAPGDIGYVNVHGSGASLGDEAELAALRRVFGLGPTSPWLNATKALTGHCLSAAAVVEAVASIIQMSGGFLHVTVGLTRPIHDGYRFVESSSEHIRARYTLSNSFGFGGFSTSIILGNVTAEPTT